MSDSGLTDEQLNELASSIARMKDRIMAYFNDPEHERAFNEWREKRNAIGRH